MATLATLGQPVTQPQPPPTDGQQPSGQFEEGKIFVGGLLNATTEDTLRSYFENFGETADVQIMVDPVTNRSRGFGFVTFKDTKSVKAVLDGKPHTIDGKIVDPKPAVQKGVDVAPTGLLIHATKIFIGGVPQGTVKDDIERYFSQFGKVVEIDLKLDRYTQRMRGFGFVGFANEESAKKAAETPFHSLNGKTVEVKPAEPRGKTPSGAGKGHQQGYLQQQGYNEYSHAQQGQFGYHRNGMGGYNPGYAPYPGPPPPPSYPQYSYPPHNVHYSQQYSNQDYNGYNYGQSSYGQESGYNNRAGNYNASGTDYSVGAAYSSYPPEQNSQYTAYNDPTPTTGSYGRGAAQPRFNPGYGAR